MARFLEFKIPHSGPDFEKWFFASGRKKVLQRIPPKADANSAWRHFSRWAIKKRNASQQRPSSYFLQLYFLHETTPASPAYRLRCL